MSMSMHAAGDIPLQITSENSSSERRITPSWTIGQLKAKLEPITGIPPLSQKLTLKLGSRQSVPMEAADEENTQLGVFPLAPYAEIHLSFEFIDGRFAKRVVILSFLARPAHVS
jgi:tubulin-specific chaperone B